jgi:ankyrin repeat protein
VGLVLFLSLGAVLFWAVWQFRRKEPAVMAVQEGDIESLRLLLDQGRIDVDHKYWEGRAGGYTLLHIAANRADPDAVQLLLERGADPNVRDNWDEHALYRLLDKEPTEPAIRCIRLLLAAGARLDIEDNNGHDSPLSRAVSNRCPEYVAMLLEAGAPVNQAGTLHGYTPLIIACCQYEDNPGSLECIRLLLKAGADPSIKSKSGSTALSIAESNKRPTFAQMIRDALRQPR